MSRFWRAALLTVTLGALYAGGLAAQRPGSSILGDTAQLRRAAEARLGRSVSQTEILDRLRQSGMTRAQARARLQQLGYDPSLADKYYDAIEGGGEPPTGEVSGDFVSALRRMGIAVWTGVRAPGVVAADNARPDAVTADTLVAPETTRPGELEVFGRSLFDRRTNQFAPIVNGPVDPSYRLGPGDELSLILTGDVEQAYDLLVTRDGYIIIPDVGQVNGERADDGAGR